MSDQAYQNAVAILLAGSLPTSEDFAALSEHVQGILAQLVWVNASLVEEEAHPDEIVVWVELKLLDHGILLECLERGGSRAKVETSRFGKMRCVAKTGTLCVSQDTFNRAMLALLADRSI